MFNDGDIKIELLHDSQIQQSDNFINFKIIIIGDSGVGKSSLIKRAVQNIFDSNYQPTIGFEFLLMHFNVNDEKIKLQIWDTCGQEMYRSLVQGFYRNTAFALLVYDISRKNTFKNLDIWLQDIRKHTNEDLPIFIAGNKNDLERKVSFDEAKVYAKSNRSINIMECSAKTGENSKEIFFEIAKFLYQTHKNVKENKSLSNRLIIESDNKNYFNKKKKCC